MAIVTDKKKRIWIKVAASIALTCLVIASAKLFLLPGVDPSVRTATCSAWHLIHCAIPMMPQVPDHALSNTPLVVGGALLVYAGLWLRQRLAR